MNHITVRNDADRPTQSPTTAAVLRPVLRRRFQPAPVAPGNTQVIGGRRVANPNRVTLATRPR